MTKRKLRGPASVRNKAKKSKPEASDSPETALEDETKPAEDAPQPPATILKEEGQATLMADENSILKRMAELEEEMESGDITGNEEDNEDVANTKRTSEEGNGEDRLLGMNDVDEESADDDEKQVENNSKVEEGSEESETLKTMLTQKVRIIIEFVIVKTSMQSKDKTIKSLEGKIRSLEAEKVELTTKYKKYKDMAVKLTKEKGSSGKGFGGDNKDLEEENQELKMKLRSVLDELKDKEEKLETKGDVSSKLSLKDHLLQQQIIKNEELELKFKKFLMTFQEKFSKGGGGSLTENASSILKSSLQESKVQEHLSNTAQPGETPKRVPKSDNSTNKTPTVTNPPPKTAEAGSKKDQFKESLSSRLSKVQKPTSEVNKNPINKSISKKVIASKPGLKGSEGEGGAGSSQTSQDSQNLNNSLPVTSSSRGMASRRRSLATAAPVSASKETEKSNKENTPAVTKTRVPDPKGKPDKNLPSKLLANSSISIGRQDKPIPKGVSLQKSSSPVPSSASAKLSKLSGSSLSISSSPSNPTPTPKVNLPPNSSISMAKSAPTERNVGSNQKGKGNPNTSKLLKNSGISFSKVSTDAASAPNSPVSKPAPPTRSLSSLKGLNISLSKPEGDDNEEQTSERGGNAMTASKQATVSKSLAIVTAETQEENEEPISPVPQKPTQAKKRGPTSAKRKAPLPQSNKLSFAKKDPKDTASDEKLLDESSTEGESLSLTFQTDNDSETHSVSIPIEDNILKDLSFNSALDLGSVDKEADGGEAASYESLLSRVSSELDSITKTNKKVK